MTGIFGRLLPACTCIALVAVALALRQGQQAARPEAIQETWQRVDRPVATGRADRTWLWGPLDTSFQKQEAYAESPGGKRTVVYFDKSRMEITNPDGDQANIWFVANGVLVQELVSGRMQVGDHRFIQREPASVNVAGDPDDPNSPTYASFDLQREMPPAADGAPLIQRLARNGEVTDDQSLARWGVTAAYRLREPGIDHQIASVFWDFMNSSGLVYDDGVYGDAALFENPFYATGYPITEAYWARVKVAGTEKDVLIQCFERRCLTYTPDNPDGWKVEAGNVGQHYYAWRYGEDMP